MTLPLLVLLALIPPDDDLRPLTVAVVDAETGGPVTSLRYRVFYQAPGRAPRLDEAWTPVESADGTFAIPAPASCEIHLQVKGRDHLGGLAMDHDFVLRAADPRRVVVKLRPGIVVRGTVRDAATGAPIAGAKVQPISPNGPMRVSYDDEWAVETDREGHYELRGVDPENGVSASHLDYQGEKEGQARGAGPRHDIALVPGEVLRGTVRDPSGKPLEGVDVVDREGRKARTGPDGTFALKNGSTGMTLTRDGYVQRRLLGFEHIPRERFVVVMEPVSTLEGGVVGADGRPLEAFRISAGPGAFPRDYESAKREVRGRDGRFSLVLERRGPHWVGVRAEGFAAWEGMADVAQGGSPIVVRLEPGVTVLGRVDAPAREGGAVRATLTPRRDKSDHGGMPADHTEAFATLGTSVAPDGTLRFEHVRPDRYLLNLDGPTIAPARLAVDVPAGGRDLGPIRLAGRGRVVGRVFRPAEQGGKAWEFAPIDALWPAEHSTDYWAGEHTIASRADEDGRFTIEGVPAGLARVCFQFQVFDVIHSHVWQARVVEGRTTEVHAFEPGRERPLTIQLDVGDGSDAQYLAGSGRAAGRLVENVTRKHPEFLTDEEKAAKAPALREPLFFPELTPRSREPLAFSEPEWSEPDARRQIVLPDVAPGPYRLRVLDFLGSTELTDGVLYDGDITVESGKPVRISLGAGCITGRGPKTDDFDRRVVAVAIPRDGRGPARRSRCDDDGNFCVRYLPPGRYTLRLHDPDSGWAQVDDVSVGVGATDVGDLILRPGGSILASVAFRRPVAVPDEVVLTDPDGVALTTRFAVYSSFDRLEVRGLWPGRWSVAFRAGGETIASGDATVSGTGPARVPLATEPGKGP